MADGASGVKQFTEEMEQAAGEVAKDVKDSVGEALEQGVQSVVGTQLTPQQIQQKEAEDQKKLAEARKKLAFFQQTAQKQQVVSQQNQQKEMQRLQAQKQEEQNKKIEKVQIQQSSKRPGQPLTEEIARTQVERSKGRGVGG